VPAVVPGLVVAEPAVFVDVDVVAVVALGAALRDAFDCAWATPLASARATDAAMRWSVGLRIDLSWEQVQGV
jgi:hypothetical protein